jgi:transposase
MSRYKPLIERNANDRIELRGIVQNPLSDPDLTIRAKAILLFFDGSKGDAIAKELKVRPNTVSDWRKRYELNGIEGLYDKAPKGKRGSEARNKVLKLVEEAPPEGGWSTKALADAVGTSQDTVRRALKDQHLSVSCETIWDMEISRSPAGVWIDPIGLFLSKEEAGLIIRVERSGRHQSKGHSFITTSNRNLAKSMAQMSRTQEGLSLEEAIQASVHLMKEVPRGEKESFQKFTGRLLNDKQESDGDKAGLYYIMYWHEKNKDVKPILQRSGIAVQMTEDCPAWIKMIEPWLKMMIETASVYEQSSTHERTSSLLSSIQLFLSKTTELVEPFEWVKMPSVSMNQATG